MQYIPVRLCHCHSNGVSLCLIKANFTLLHTLPLAVLKDYEGLDDPYLIDEETKLQKCNHTPSITTLISDPKTEARGFYFSYVVWLDFIFVL